MRPFDPPAHPWEAGHRGVDLAARADQVVHAAGPGRVGFARDLAGRGVVTVVHGRLRTTYLPVRPSVHVGEVVAAGARLGVVEDVLGHCGASPCLHWGLREGLAYFDPLTLLGRGPVRLLPWWPDASRRPVARRDVPRRDRTPARRADGAPVPVRPGAQRPSPADRVTGPSLPHGQALAAEVGKAAPDVPFALVTGVFATAALHRGRWHRASRRRGYPQIAKGLPRNVMVGQIRRRR